jgi:GNAT superfamily N-acetyltransferase
MRIRQARPDDRAFVIGLVPRLRAFGPSALRSDEALDGAEERALARAFDEMPRGAAIFVAEDDDATPLGAAYVETAIDYFTGERHGHLGILAVAADGEGKGAGRALLEEVERWAALNRFRFVTLNVFWDNARARHVYERAGWAPDTVRYLKVIHSDNRQSAVPRRDER